MSVLLKIGEKISVLSVKDSMHPLLLFFSSQFIMGHSNYVVHLFLFVLWRIMRLNSRYFDRMWWECLFFCLCSVLHAAYLSDRFLYRWVLQFSSLFVCLFVCKRSLKNEVLYSQNAFFLQNVCLYPPIRHLFSLSVICLWYLQATKRLVFNLSWALEYCSTVV